MSDEYKIRVRQIGPSDLGLWLATVLDGPGIWDDDFKMFGFGWSKPRALDKVKIKIYRKRHKARNWNDSIQTYKVDE